VTAAATKPEKLRALLSRPRPTLIVGVWDGLSAALAERAGFDGVWASGLCISTSMRIPDVGLVTMSEHLEATRRIDRATTLPVVADVDDGFGDAINVTRMVREYEAAGIAAVCIEDNHHPKRNSLYGGLARKLVTAEEFVVKIRAARDARRDPSFLVIARTEALVAELGHDEAMRRAQMYAAAGADMVLVHSKDRDPAPILEFGKQWTLATPLAAVPTTYPSVGTRELFDHGYRLIILANQGLRASISAVTDVFKTMIETESAATVEDRIAPLADVFSIVDMEGVRRLEDRLAEPEPPAGRRDPSKARIPREGCD